MNDAGREPQPLDYARPQSSSAGSAAGLFLLGAICGVAAVLFAGCGVFNVIGYPYIAGPTLPPPPSRWSAVFLFLVIMVGAIAGTVVLYRKTRRWFFIGLLLGIGIMSLLEGLCFAS